VWTSIRVWTPGLREFDGDVRFGAGARGALDLRLSRSIREARLVAPCPSLLYSTRETDVRSRKIVGSWASFSSGTKR